VDPPVLLNVSECDCAPPTSTLPNAMLSGLATSAPVVAPTPENGILNDGFVAVLVIAMLPVVVPAVVGAKLAVNEVL
jgi:hypothetical protein